MNTSNKHAAAFRLREKFIALDSQLAVRQGRATTRSADAVSCHAMNSRQLSFSFGRADDSHRELKKTLGQLSFFNSRQLSVSFGPAFRTVVYRIIQSSLNKFAWLTAAFHLNFRNVTQCWKHLEPNARLITTDMWQSILIETFWTYWKASRFCESELKLNIFVLFEGKANEIYSAEGSDPK